MKGNTGHRHSTAARAAATAVVAAEHVQRRQAQRRSATATYTLPKQQTASPQKRRVNLIILKQKISTEYRGPRPSHSTTRAGQRNTERVGRSRNSSPHAPQSTRPTVCPHLLHCRVSYINVSDTQQPVAGGGGGGGAPRKNSSKGEEIGK